MPGKLRCRVRVAGYGAANGQPRGSVKATGDLVATAAYQPEHQAAAAARRFVRQTLGSWQRSGYRPQRDGLIDDAVLLTSELVTNAILHAGTPVGVTCRLDGRAVEISVVDYSPAQIVAERQDAAAAPAERTGGRGLVLPAKLASSWGVTYAPGSGSKAVWFRINDDVTTAPAAPAVTSSATAACEQPARVAQGRSRR